MTKHRPLIVRMYDLSIGSMLFLTCRILSICRYRGEFHSFPLWLLHSEGGGETIPHKILLLLEKFFAFLTQVHNIWLEKQCTLRAFSCEERSVLTDIGLEKEKQKPTMKNLTERIVSSKLPRDRAALSTGSNSFSVDAVLFPMNSVTLAFALFLNNTKLCISPLLLDKWYKV